MGSGGDLPNGIGIHVLRADQETGEVPFDVRVIFRPAKKLSLVKHSSNSLGFTRAGVVSVGCRSRENGGSW